MRQSHMRSAAVAVAGAALAALGPGVAQASETVSPQRASESFFSALWEYHAGCTRTQLSLGGVVGTYLAGPGNPERRASAVVALATVNDCTGDFDYAYAKSRDVDVRISNVQSASLAGTFVLREWDDPSRTQTLTVDINGASTDKPWRGTTHWIAPQWPNPDGPLLSYSSNGFYAGEVSFTGSATTADSKELIAGPSLTGFIESPQSVTVEIARRPG